MSVPNVNRMPLRRRVAVCAFSVLLALGGVPVAPAVAEDAENVAAEISVQAENLAEKNEVSKQAEENAEAKRAEGLGETEGEAGESSSSGENVVLTTQDEPMSEEQDETFEVDYYINTQWDGSEVTYPVGDKKTCTVVTDTLVEWGRAEEETWYYVGNNITTIEGRVTCYGNVNLILEDNVTLTVPEGITVQAGNTLHVYVRTTDTSAMGTLIAGTEDVMLLEDHPSDAGIGGLQGEESDDTLANAGNIVIHGGNVQALGTSAGIGNGAGGNGGSVTIYSGTVTATGDEQSAGIGGGGDCGTITIYGGNVTAKGAAAGIGNGGNRYNETPGSISILGGTVEAMSEFYGAGIGGSLNSSPVPVTISGGTVTAQGGAYGGAGIGGGHGGGNGTITISGENTVVDAAGGAGAAGIGSGFDALVEGTSAGDIRSAESALIDLYGGTITAKGGSFTEDGITYAGAGIGGGASKNNSVPGAEVQIQYYSDEPIVTVTATGGSADAQGIGRGTYATAEAPSDGVLHLSSPFYLYGDTSEITDPSHKNILDGAPENGLDYTGDRPQYMLVNYKESHRFTYESDGNKITAKCQIKSCSLEANPILTLEAPENLTYDGKEKPATTAIENNATGAFEDDDVTITYTKKGQAGTCDVPKDSGNYTATVTVGGASITIGFTISKATPEVNIVTAKGLTYNGSA